MKLLLLAPQLSATRTKDFLAIGLIGLLFCQVIALSSCHKESFAFGKSTVITLPQDFDISDIVFTDSLHGYACGGKVWTTGTILQTQDGGISWQTVLNSGSLIEKLAIKPDTSLAYACGQNGCIYRKSSLDATWFQLRMDYSAWYRSLALEPNGSALLLASGEGFVGGQIRALPFGTDAPTTQDTTANELADITFVTDSIIMAVGYGYVLRSENGGNSFERIDLTGAFYTSIQFSSPTAGIIIADGGEVFHTTDSGKQWSKVTDLGRKSYLSDICFLNNSVGFICGSGGCLYKTTDGGSSWLKADGIPNEAWTSVSAVDTLVYLGGSGGKMVKLEGY